MIRQPKNLEKYYNDLNKLYKEALEKNNKNRKYSKDILAFNPDTDLNEWDFYLVKANELTLLIGENKREPNYFALFDSEKVNKFLHETKEETVTNVSFQLAKFARPSVEEKNGVFGYTIKMKNGTFKIFDSLGNTY